MKFIQEFYFDIIKRLCGYHRSYNRWANCLLIKSKKPDIIGLKGQYRKEIEKEISLTVFLLAWKRRYARTSDQ